jgi:flagellar biosynthesis chaperone FliJ
MPDGLADERLDELEEMIQSLRDDYEATRDHVIQPQIDDLEDASDDARADRAELRSEIQGLQAQVDRLQATLDALQGLSESQQTSPAARNQDLAQALIRRAEARPDDQPAKAAMWWKEIRDMMADQGHGEVSKPDCYKALEDVAQQPGFSEGTKRSDAGNQVKAVRVELDALRAESGSRNPTTRGTPSGAQSAGINHGGDTQLAESQTD